MPLVDITGVAADHGLAVMPKSLDPRLWFVPNKGHVGESGGMLLDVETQATWLNLDVGSFSARVYSDPDGDPDLWYSLRMDWIVPGLEQEAPRNRQRAEMTWPYKVYPGTGGNLSNLVRQVLGVGTVYVARDAPNHMFFNQLQLNNGSQWLYQREVQW